MKLKTGLIVTAIFGLTLGLGFYFAPGQMMATFGVQASEAHLHMARNFGSAVIALGVLSWAAKDVEDSLARKAIVLAIFTYFILGSLSILHFQLNGDVKGSAWLVFGLHVILGLFFGSHLLKAFKTGTS